VVAVNDFADSPTYPIEDLRASLDLPERVPIIQCDARDRSSGRDVLITLVRHLHELILSSEVS
jgi:uncharacterized protein